MTALVVAEHGNGSLSSATSRTVTAAMAMAKEVHVLVAGQACEAVAQAAAEIAGVGKILVADDQAYGHRLAENMAPLIAGLAPNYGHVVAPATSSGKNVMPRAAALLDAAQVSDIVAVVSPDTFVRPIYAGNALTTVRTDEAIKFITVRATAFAAAKGGGKATVEFIIGPGDSGLSEFVGEEASRSGRPELTAARVVVSGGRAMESRENFALIEELADLLVGAVGASRAAVDAGYISNDFQVGQTGKVVAPELYIAVGISGAVQHLAGMKDSKVIVAINKDQEAPIFQVADYGLVGDLFEHLPQLIAELKRAPPSD